MRTSARICLSHYYFYSHVCCFAGVRSTRENKSFIWLQTRNRGIGAGLIALITVQQISNN